MMSLTNFLAAVAVLLTMFGGIVASSVEYLTKASLYDVGFYKPVYKASLSAELDIALAIDEEKEINKRVSGLCHHDYETITEQSAEHFFTVFTQEFPGDGKMTMRLELDVFHIYDCENEQLYDSVVTAANFNIDKLQEAGYDVRVWFTEMPDCLGQKLPMDITDLIPEVTGLIRPHVLPSKDPQKFQEVIESLVRTFTIDRTALNKQPVTLYEGWNEVESPGYFFGTRDQLVDNILIPMIKAVEQVEQEVGYELLFASHSVANGSEGFTTYVNKQVNRKIEEKGYEVDWINWHWYGMFPFHNEVPPDLEPVMSQFERSNPWATPKEMGRQTRVMKNLFPDKKLMISEWNWAAGGVSEVYDSKAAAYVSGALIEMHHAGLDDANHFLLKANDGFFNDLDQINPTGHAIKFFHQLGAKEIKLNGINPGDFSHDVSAIAAYDEDRITIMLAKFFGAPNPKSTSVQLNLKSIKELINSEEFTIHLSIIDTSVFTDHETVDTFYNVFLVDNELELSIDLEPQTTVFIQIDTSEITGIVSSVFQNQNNFDFNIYPNPSQGIVNLEHDLSGIVDLEVFDLNGKLVYTKQNIYKQELINLKYNSFETLVSGSYIMKLTNGKDIASKKFLIQIN